jgi:hypothetical protein
MGSPSAIQDLKESLYRGADSVALKSGEIRMIKNTHDAIAGMVHELIANHTLG